MAGKSYTMDMTEGSIIGKMIVFALPLMLSSVLQLLFNAADVIVVGRFAGEQSLAAVGSTGALINLLISVLMGLSVGANVLIARYYGADDAKNCQESIQSSILFSLVGGAVMALVGIALARPLLFLMGTPEDVIDKSVTYMRIYFAGMPVMALYNFGSAVLRSKGDTRRPLYFLIAAGLLNVGLNLLFVIEFHMDVAGVALATVISQALSAALILTAIIRDRDICRLDLRGMRFYSDKMKEMVRIGLPAGLQGAVFSISNVLIQSSVNSFGSLVMAGNTAAANIEGFIYVAMNSIYQTSLSFSSQNVGARKYKRLTRITLDSVGLVTVIGLILGMLALLLRYPLLGIYTDNTDVIKYGIIRMMIICPTYWLCGIMDTMVGNLRGLGYSVMPMIVSLTGACGLRVVWILTLFRMDPSQKILYISYPVSWAVTALAHIICYLVVKRKFDKDHQVDS